MTGNFEMRNVQGNFAGVGPGAKGSITIGSEGSSPTRAEIEHRLAELRSLLEQHAGALEDRQAAESAVTEAEQELRSPQPQPGRLRMFLNAVTGAASGVTAVTAAVSAVKDLLGGLQ